MADIFRLIRNGKWFKTENPTVSSININTAAIDLLTHKVVQLEDNATSIDASLGTFFIAGIYTLVGDDSPIVTEITNATAGQIIYILGNPVESEGGYSLSIAVGESIKVPSGLRPRVYVATGCVAGFVYTGEYWLMISGAGL